MPANDCTQHGCDTRVSHLGKHAHFNFEIFDQVRASCTFQTVTSFTCQQMYDTQMRRRRIHMRSDIIYMSTEVSHSSQIISISTVKSLTFQH